MRSEWSVVEPIVDAALDLAPDRRSAYLDRVCAGDPVLRADVEAVLAGAEASLLDTPAAELGASMFRDEELGVAPVQEGTLIGPYRVIRELGHGGMGVVYLAQRADGGFEQRVALKLVKRGMDSDDILRRFLAERQVLARLNHPHIARLLDGGVTAQGQPYFAMEYVDGVPLDRHCDAASLGIEERLRLFEEVCEAVQYAHGNLVVHRDLKPSNILVTPNGGTRLLDFGIAKVLDQDAADQTVTQAEHRLMTPEYAAPEQVTGEPVTTATDVYSLGAILYRLVAGRPVYRLPRGDRMETLRIICNVDPEPPGTRGDLDVIVLKALRKDPARRYSSVEALVEDLRRFRGGLPVHARPDSVGYRARKFLARNRLGVAAVALLILSLAAGLAGTLWQARATSREAARARAVKDFVLGLFRGSTPEEARGREVTARELLERGARRVETGLAREPALQTEFLGVLGAIHRDLGLYPEADSLLERAVRLTEARHGGAHPDVAARRSDWAMVLADRGDYARAESLLTDANRILRRERGPRDTTLASSLAGLASVQRRQGNFAAAESLYREALAIHGSLQGGELRVAEDLDQLGLVLVDAGSLVRADSAHQAAITLRRHLLDPDHPDMIASLHHLAALRERQTEYVEAERLQREVLERRRRLYPGGHPDVASALQNLIRVLQIQGGFAEAESLSVEAHAMLRSWLGADHPMTLKSVSDLATVKYDRGDLPGAEAGFRDALAGWERSLGRDNPTTLAALNDLGAVLRYQRRYAEAEPLFREVLTLRRRRLGDAHPDVAASSANLAELLREKGDLAAAEAAYRTTLAIYSTALPPGNVLMAGALIGLGGVLTDAGRAAEAEPMLRRALDLRVEKLGVTDRRTARAQRSLGVCLAALGRREEAEQLLLQSYATLESATNFVHRTLRTAALHDLVALYDGWGRPADAAKFRRLLRED